MGEFSALQQTTFNIIGFQEDIPVRVAPVKIVGKLVKNSTSTRNHIAHFSNKRQSMPILGSQINPKTCFKGANGQVFEL